MIVIGCSSEEFDTKGNATLVIKTLGNTTTEKYQIKDATAHDLLKYKHDIKLTYGNYLECIDNVCANKEYIWTFYVNDAESPLGVKQYEVKRDDRIEFRFGKGD